MSTVPTPTPTDAPSNGPEPVVTSTPLPVPPPDAVATPSPAPTPVAPAPTPFPVASTTTPTDPSAPEPPREPPMPGHSWPPPNPNFTQEIAIAALQRDRIFMRRATDLKIDLVRCRQRMAQMAIEGFHLLPNTVSEKPVEGGYWFTFAKGVLTPVDPGAKPAVVRVISMFTPL